MATLEEIVVQLTAEVSGLKAGMTEATKSVDAATTKMDKAIEEFSNNSKKNVGFFQTAMATMSGFLGSQAVLGAFNLLKQGVGALIGELEDGAKAAMAEETALKQLANSLALTGNFTNDAINDLKNYTGEMESLTGVQDDVIASNLAVLSSLTKLDAEGLKKAQTAALDLSASMGRDLGSTTQLIAKGIEGNTDAFKRLGIEVEAGATKSQRLDNILKALATTQGAAAGATDTFAGAAKKLENSYGNLVEEIAKSVIQNPVVVAGMKAIAAVFDDLTKSAEGSGTELRTSVANGFIAVTEALSLAIKTADVFFKTVGAAMDLLRIPVNAVDDAIQGLVDMIDGVSGSSEPFAATKKSFEDLTNAFSGDTALGKVADTIDIIGAKAGESFGKLGDAAAAVQPSVIGAKEKVVDLTNAEKQHIEVLKSFSEELAKQGATAQATYTFQAELYKGLLDQKTISQNDYFALSTTNLANQQATEQAMLEEAHAKGLSDETQYQNAKTALAQKQALDSLKLQTENQKAKEANLKSSLDTISTLSNSSNKELAALGKAAAITQATIDGFAAVQKALAAAPPPFNFALAAAVGVATAANIAKIAGVGLAKGIDSVPGQGNQDNFPAVLQPGERVVQTEANKDLTDFLESQKNGGSLQRIEIMISMKDELVNFIEAQILERQKLGTSQLAAAGG